MWHWLLYLLASAAAEPDLLKVERARTAGAVNVAYASLATEPAPAPKSAEQTPPCPCGGRGYTMRPDGSRWACKCQQCPAGNCPRR